MKVLGTGIMWAPEVRLEFLRRLENDKYLEKHLIRGLYEELLIMAMKIEWT